MNAPVWLELRSLLEDVDSVELAPAQLEDELLEDLRRLTIRLERRVALERQRRNGRASGSRS